MKMLAIMSSVGTGNIVDNGLSLCNQVITYKVVFALDVESPTSIAILKYSWETNIRACEYSFLDARGECEYRFLAGADTRVFVGGYKTYIHMIWTLR